MVSIPALLRRFRASGALLVVLIILGSFMISPDRLLLFPTREPLSAIGAQRRTVPSEDGALEIWTGSSHPQAEKADCCLLRFYGNADRADPNVGIEGQEWGGDPSVEIWGVNYPGYGGSAGAARLSSIAPAALAAFDALKTHAGGRPIVVFGTSLGTAAALHVAAHRPVAGLILQNPPPLRQIVLRQFGWWNLWLIAGPLALRIPGDLDSVANARASHGRALFLLAEDDEIVQPRYQRLVVKAYAGEKRVVSLAGAHHNDPLRPSELATVRSGVRWMLSVPAPR